MSERIEVRLHKNDELLAWVCVAEGYSLSNVEYFIKEGWKIYSKMENPSSLGYHSFADFLCSKYDYVFRYDVPCATFYV